MVAVMTGSGLGVKNGSGFVLGSRGMLGDSSVGRFGENVTINAATGNVFINRTDEVLLGLGSDGAIARSYNSLGLLNDDNGDNWRASAQRQLDVVTAGATLRLTDWDGSRTLFSWDAGFVRADSGTGAYVSKEGDGAFDYITLSGSLYALTHGATLSVDVFDGANGGRITTTRDSGNNQTSYSYDGSGKLSRVTTASGEYTDFTWSGNNIIQLVTSYQRVGKEAEYAAAIYRIYSGALDRAPEVQGYSGSLNALLEGTTTLLALGEMVYSSAEFQNLVNGQGLHPAQMNNTQYGEFLYNRVLRRASDSGGLAAIVAALDSGAQTRGLALLNFCEAAEHKNLVQTLPGRTPPALSQMTRVSYGYDGSNRLTSVAIDRTPAGNFAGDAVVDVISYTYDGSSKRVASIAETGSGTFVSFTYVQVGADFRVASVTEAGPSGDRTTSFSYDAGNRRTSVTDALGKVSILGYDTSGNLTSITSPADGSGGAPQVVQFAYNANGDVISYTDGLGRLTAYSYEAHGNLTESVDPAGNRMRYEYNSANLLLKTVLVLSTTGLDRLPGGGVDTAFYTAHYSDIAGQGDFTDPTRHYDSYGRFEGRNPNALFNTAYYLSTYPEIAASGMNPLEHYLQYGWREGRLPAPGVTTAEYIARYVNQTTRYAYDGAGRLRFGVTPEGRVTEYRYNSAGQKIATINYTDNVYPVGWTLNSWDNVTEAQVAAWVVGLGSTTAIQRTDTAYDFRGNVAATTDYADLNVNRVQFSQFEQGTTGWWMWHSQANVLQGSTVVGTDAGTGKQYLQQSFTASSTGDLMAFVSNEMFVTTGGERIAVRAGIGTSAADCNVFLRVQFFDANGNWLSPSEISAGELHGAFSFNSPVAGFIDVPADARRLRLVVYASSNTTGVSRTVTLTEPMIAQVAAGETVMPGFVPGVATNTLPLGATGSATYNRTTYVYDQFGNLLSKAQSGTVGSEVYTYDGLGRILTATDLAGAQTTSAYNHANRTTTITLANGLTKTSVYSAQGEILSYTEAAAGIPTEVETYGYDKLGRLRITSDAVGMGDFTFYDDAGRKTGYMDRKGQLTEYRHDAANRLVATIHYATPMTAGAITALFDGSGNASKATITGARPPASNYDRWEWTVYDNADHVAQKIETVRGSATEGQSGKVTTYSYDRAGNLEQTVESANMLTPAMVALLIANTPGTNRLYNAAFEGAAGWAAWNGQGIINAGSPNTAIWDNLHHIRANFTASSGGQTASIYSNTAFEVAAGQQLSVQTGVEAIGVVGTLNLVVWWFDANGALIHDTPVATLSGQQNYNTQMQGTVTVPVGAHTGRFELYMTTSAAGAGWFNLVEPKVTTALQGATVNRLYNTQYGSIEGWDIGYDPQNIRAGSPFVGQGLGQSYVRANFNATASGQVISLATAFEQSFKVAAGERIAVRSGIEAIGPIGDLNLQVWFFDVAGNNVGGSNIAGANGQKTFGTLLSGFATAPAGAVKARLELYGWTTGAGAGWIVLTAPMVSGATSTQTQLPGFTPSLAVNGYDRVTRNFYSKDGLLIGQLDGVGALVRFNYDRAGRLTKTTRYANLAAPSLWTSGTFGQIVANVGQSSWDQTVYTVYDGTGRVRYTLNANMRPTEFVYDAAGQVVRTIEYAGSIEASSAYTMNDVKGRIAALDLSSKAATRVTRSVYDGAGRLNFTINALGGVTSYGWDNAKGQVIRTVQHNTFYTGTGDPSNADMWSWFTGNFIATDAVTRSVYDALNRLVYEQNAEGFITEYRYDLNDRVIKTIGYPGQYWLNESATVSSVAALIGNAVTNPQTVVIGYGYDANGQMIDQTDGEGVITHFEYNAFGQQTRRFTAWGTADESVDGWLYDAAGRVLEQYTAMSTAETASTFYIYDGVGNLLSVWTPPNGATWYGYDSAGNRTFQTVRTDNATDTRVTSTFQYDAFGHLVRTTDPLGFSAYAYYDKLGHITLQIDAEGFATRTNYSGLGTVSSIVRFYNRATGIGDVGIEPSIAVDGRDASTSIAYDRLGRTLSTTDALGYIESYGYDAFGNRTAVTNKLGGVTNYTYYRTGLLKSEWHLQDSYGGDSATRIDDDVVTTYGYDSRGNLLTKVEASNVAGHALTTSYTYNRRNELLTLTDPAFLNLLPVTQYQYDKRSNVILQIAADGGKTYRFYDDNDRKVAEISPVNTLSKWTYDLNGNVKTLRVFGGISAFPANPGGAQPADAGDYRETSFDYDARSYLTKTTLNAVTIGSVSGSNLVTEYRNLIATNLYDSDGRLTVDTDARGAQTYHYYDKLGREVAKRDAEGYLTRWTHDGEGNVLTETRYANRVYGTLPVGGETPPAVTADPANDRVTTFTYDKMGRRLSETRQGVSVGSIGTNGQLHSTTDEVTIYYTYNGLGEVTAKSEASVGVSNWSLGYNPQGIATGSVVEGVWNGVDYAKLQFNATTNAQAVSLFADYYAPLNANSGDQLYVELGLEGQGPVWYQDAYVFFFDDAGNNIGTGHIGLVNGVVALNDRLGNLISIPAGATRIRLEVYINTSGAGAGSLVIAEPRLTIRTPQGGTLGAFGARTDFSYDNFGRLTRQQDPVMQDFSGGEAGRTRHTIYYRYDANNNLVRTEEQVEAPGGGFAAGYDGSHSRINRYYYSGRTLQYSFDAMGYGHSYWYDAMGRQTHYYYERTRSDDTVDTTNAIMDGQLTTYDKAGRVGSQWSANWTSGNVWATVGPVTAYGYNAYGDVTTKFVGGQVIESFDYDKLGRVTKTNSGDGVWKFFLYDANGNATLTLVNSTGAGSQGGQSRDDELNSLTGGNYARAGGPASTSLGMDSFNQPAVTVSLASYDWRNMMLVSQEPGRQIANAADVSLTTVARLTRSRGYNAFGEVVIETDARGYATNYTYNTVGKLVRKESPTVSWTAENGLQNNARPTEEYRHDASGRLVAVHDANGNWTTRNLLAGTGYGGSEALVLKEFHPDGGIVENGYDAFGDKRFTINELGATEYFAYDKLHRLQQHKHAVRSDGTLLINEYRYDILGQRVKHWNSLLGGGVVETTDYDIQGRITKQVDLGGDTTWYSYGWYGDIVAAGSGIVAGGWQKITTNAAGKTSYDNSDYFGRLIWRRDAGGHDYAYTFNAAGQQTQQTNSAGEVVTYSYYNTGLIATMVSGIGSGYGSNIISSYQYDVDGNRLYESYVANVISYDYYFYQSYNITTTHQQARVTWDGMNRMTSYTDTGSSSGNPVSVSWEYDLNGNIRHMNGLFRYLDVQGNVVGSNHAQDYWYRYDSMNRSVLAKGTFSGTRGSGAILRGMDGVTVTYNAAGQRTTALLSRSFYGEAYNEWMAMAMQPDPFLRGDYQGDSLETYSYTADGYLQSVQIAKSEAIVAGTWQYSYLAGGVLGASVNRASYTRDAMGRVTGYTEYDDYGSSVHSRTTTFDAKSQVTYDYSSTKVGNDTNVTATTYSYNATDQGGGVWKGVTSGGSYMGGAVTKTAASVWKNGSSQTGNTSTNSFVWWDNAMQKAINYDSGGTHNVSTFYYDSSGHLQSIYIQDGRSRTVTFITDAQGQVLQRDENDSLSTGDPRALHYYFAGKKIGDISNNGTPNVDYYESIKQRTTPSGTGPFRNDSATQLTSIDFDQSYDAINGNIDASASQYTVQAGDTLEGIAQKLWGDSSYWYLIAQANGLSGSASLSAGRSLVLPNKIHNSHNNSSTFRVYDPNEAIGDTSPTAVKPRGKNCGAFGQILLIAIAVAVTMIALPGAGAATLGQGLLAGAAGSGASQAVGLVTGIQNKFDFKGFALSALAGGVTAGLGPKGFFGANGANGAFSGVGEIGSQVLRGVAGSAITQGIGLATGLQDKFSWAGIASAGLAPFVSSGLSGKFGAAIGGFGRKLVANTASGIVGAAAESLISGADFGDNLIAALPSVIANTIGNLVADGIAGRGRSGATGAGDASSTQPTTGEGGGQVGDSGDIVVTARRGGGYNPVAAAVAQTVAGSNGDGDPQATAEIVLTADGRPYKVLDTHRGASNLGEWQRWYDNYRQDDPNFDKYSNSAETQAAFANDRALLEKGTALADKNTGDLLYYGIGLPAQMALEAVTGELVIGGAVKGYRAWQAGRAIEGAALTGVRANQLAGASREALVRSELAAQYPGATIQNEVYLRTATGARAIDPFTGTARRIDSIVIRNGGVLDSVEVTSMTASKDAQILKEMTIRNSGGTFIRDRASGQLLDIGQVPTRLVRKP